VLLDPDSVRVLDASGRVVSVARIPRQGDTIRSPIDPAGFVYPISSTDRTFARRLRSELEKLVSTWKVGGRDPLIDLGGRFWYFRRDTTHRPLFVLDRVDDAGQPDVALLQDSFGQWRMRVGANSVATIRYRPDTTAIIAVTRFAEPFSRSGDGSLGRCSASFGY